MPKKLTLSLTERKRAINLLIDQHTVESATQLLHSKYHSHLPIEMVRMAYFPGGGAFRISHLEGATRQNLRDAAKKIEAAYKQMQERGRASAARLQSKEVQEKAKTTRWNDELNLITHAERSRQSLALLRKDPTFFDKIKAGVAPYWAEKRKDTQFMADIAARLADFKKQPDFQQKVNEGIERYFASERAIQDRLRRSKKLTKLRKTKAFENNRFEGMYYSQSFREGFVTSDRILSKFTPVIKTKPLERQHPESKTVLKFSKPENTGTSDTKKEPTNLQPIWQVVKLTHADHTAAFNVLRGMTAPQLLEIYRPLELAVISDHFRLRLQIPDDVFKKSTELSSVRWHHILNIAIQKLLIRKSDKEGTA